MAKIDQVEIVQIDIAPKVLRTDAIQSFVTQETVLVTLRCDDGSGGAGFELMVDANQSFTLSEAIRRARQFTELDLAWFEEPMPAEHVAAHARLLANTSLPIAVGESMYHLSQFGEYLAQGACSIVQADVARVGGITPWLKIAHLAEANNIAICPHFLMELHVSLCAAVPNSRWLEYIPQLDDLTTGSLLIEAGHAVAPDAPGLGIAWDAERLAALRKFEPIVL